MALQRIQWNNPGFKEVLHSSGVQSMLRDEAQQIADRASAQVSDGEGFRARVVNAGSRYIGIVGTTDHTSVVAESEDKVLSRSVVPHA